MDTLRHLIDGFGVAFSPINLLIAAIGSFIGTVVGLLPGLAGPQQQRATPELRWRRVQAVRLDEVHRLPAHRHQLARHIRPPARAHAVQALAEGDVEVAGGMPGGAAAESVRLQQHHPAAEFGQQQGQRQAGDAAADDEHLGFNVALQRLVFHGRGAIAPDRSRGQGQADGHGGLLIKQVPAIVHLGGAALL